MPTISVVTVCYNNLEELQATLASVSAQKCPPFEHIIVNGSTTPAIAEWFAATQQPSWRRIINERDEGISDAFNKGIKAAQGEVVHLLHAGDTYYHNLVLCVVAETFSKHPNTMWLHGRYMQTRGGEEVISGKPYQRTLLYRGMRTIGHLGMFVKKSLYEKHGFFDKEKKIAMDYDLLVRIADEPFIWLAEPLVNFDPSGVSNRRVWEGMKEVIGSYESRFGFSAKARAWALRSYTLDRFTRSLLGKYWVKWRTKQ